MAGDDGERNASYRRDGGRPSPQTLSTTTKTAGERISQTETYDGEALSHISQRRTRARTTRMTRLLSTKMQHWPLA